jgi:enoyl-CoA hydratase
VRGERVSYELRDDVGTIDMDDGKVNVMSLAMQADLASALDRAESEGAVLVLRGRPGVFSAGFDLKVLQEGSDEATRMVLGGFELAHRLLSYPRPVLVVCTGHAIAMGAFLVLSGDYRLAVNGPTRLTANEVAIGLTMPRTATELLRQRLVPAAFQRAVLLAEVFDPPEAARAGFVDEVVDQEELDSRIDTIVSELVQLDVNAQRATKQRTRAPLLATIKDAIAADRAEYEAQLGPATFPV